MAKMPFQGDFLGGFENFFEFFIWAQESTIFCDLKMGCCFFHFGTLHNFDAPQLTSSPRWDASHNSSISGHHVARKSGSKRLDEQDGLDVKLVQCSKLWKHLSQGFPRVVRLFVHRLAPHHFHLLWKLVRGEFEINVQHIKRFLTVLQCFKAHICLVDDKPLWGGKSLLSSVSRRKMDKRVIFCFFYPLNLDLTFYVRIAEKKITALLPSRLNNSRKVDSVVDSIKFLTKRIWKFEFNLVVALQYNSLMRRTLFFADGSYKNNAVPSWISESWVFDKKNESSIVEI